MNMRTRTIASFFTVAMAAMLLGAVVTSQIRPETAMARPADPMAEGAATAAVPRPQGPLTLDTFRDVARLQTNGVVNINTRKLVRRQRNDQFHEFFGDDFMERFFGPQGGGDRPRTQQSLGSGFIVDKAGYILTNRHVVEGADEITVSIERKDYKAKLVGRDARTDVALLNAMIHAIIDEGLVNEAFVKDRTSGFEALKENAKNYSPEKMAPICGIPAQTIREVARLFATSRGSMILWGMGISQHVHGTDNARCLIALTLMTGQIGRPGTGLHPLRGQNNVQGASDSGLIPMMFPDYQRVDNPEANKRFEKLWGTALEKKPGLTVVEVIRAADAGQVRGMYIMGENPAMSDPDAEHARAAMAKFEHLVVQDIFLTETCYLADVVLPATAWPEKDGTVTNTDRMVQLGRKAIEPPGEAKPDLWILNELARRIGLPWDYTHPKQVFDEMRQGMNSIAGITWERLERDSCVVYPCENEGDPGQPVVFTEVFPTATGRAKFVPADIIPADERPDAEYPVVLITGRQLEHWHTGAMTRRAGVLDAIEPEAVCSIHPLDLAALGVKPGEVITVASRRGSISLYARVDEGTPRGAVFIPFAFYEAAANMLTNPKLDPFGKIPEFKYCAVRVTKGGPRPGDPGYGKGRTLGIMAG